MVGLSRILETYQYQRFKSSELPIEERKEADSINSNLNTLHHWATNYWCAKSLFDNCTSQRVLDFSNEKIYHGWQLCAARDCVMSIYHFGKTIEGVDISLGRCPTLQTIIDSAIKRSARKKFENIFPSYVNFRHAIAHSAERSHTTSGFKRHGKTKPKMLWVTPFVEINADSDDSLILLHDNIYGTTFSSMWKGHIVRLEITDQTGLDMDGIIGEMWQAFSAIIDAEPEALPTVTVSRRPSR